MSHFYLFMTPQIFHISCAFVSKHTAFIETIINCVFQWKQGRCSSSNHVIHPQTFLWLGKMLLMAVFNLYRPQWEKLLFFTCFGKMGTSYSSNPERKMGQFLSSCLLRILFAAVLLYVVVAIDFRSTCLKTCIICKSLNSNDYCVFCLFGLLYRKHVRICNRNCLPL